jgi:hypothetical protein
VQLTGHRVLAHYPYEVAMACDVVWQLELTPALDQWHRELAFSVGSRPDNKETFRLYTDSMDDMFVQFWDGTVSFAPRARLRGGRRYFELDGAGERVERMSPPEGTEA